MDDHTAIESDPPFYRIPQEILQRIIEFTTQAGRISLYQTCQSLRTNDALFRAIFAEPLSRDCFPMTYEEIYQNSSHRLSGVDPWTLGFAKDLHDPQGVFDDFISLKGCGGIQDTDYLSPPQLKFVRQKLDERTAPYVERLAIPIFLPFAELRPFTLYCRNVRYLDLATFLNGIDEDDMEALPPAIAWVEPPFLASVRSLKVGCSMSRDKTFGFRILGSILNHCPSLECLEIQGKQQHRRELRRKDPRDICKLIEILTSSAARSLFELRLDNTLFLVRSYKIYLGELAAALPNLTKVAVTISQDLQRLGWRSPDLGVLDTSNDLVGQLSAETTWTTWQYMQGLRELSERFAFTSLDKDGTHALDLSLFCSSRCPRNLRTVGARVELLEWFHQQFRWSPTFNWRIQWTTYKNNWSRYNKLEMRRVVCKELKRAGIPVQLAISTQYQWDHLKKQEQDYGSFYTAVWKQVCPQEPCDQRRQWLHACGQCSGKWCFDDFGDLVDHLSVCCTFIFSHLHLQYSSDRLKHSLYIDVSMLLTKFRSGGHTFLRQPTLSEDKPFICQHGDAFDDRPAEERVEEEKQEIQRIWNILRGTYPNLLRLELHIPAPVYIGDKAMQKLLPGMGWRLEHGKDVVVTDYRKMMNVKVQPPVTFLNRVFSREPVTVPVIGIDPELGEMEM